MLGGLLVALHLIPGGIEFQAGYPASQDRLVDPVTAHSQHPYDIAQVTVGSAGLIVFELPENDSLDRSNLDPLAFDVANDTVPETRLGPCVTEELSDGCRHLTFRPAWMTPAYPGFRSRPSLQPE